MRSPAAVLAILASAALARPGSLAAQTPVIPPGPVVDLEVVAVNGGLVTLRWTKPASGDYVLNAVELKLSTVGPIDSEQSWQDSDWAGFRFLTAWAEDVSIVVVDADNSLPDNPPLVPGQSYWFAVRYLDYRGNRADLSNSATTAPAADPPGSSPSPTPTPEGGGQSSGRGCAGSAPGGLGIGLAALAFFLPGASLRAGLGLAHRE